MSTLAGIDVSNNNGTVDWETWRGRIQFAGVKVSQGLDFADPDAARNMAGAKGIGVVRMAYHFLLPSLSGAEQADYFLRLARAAGLAAGDLVMVDVEDADGCTVSEISGCASDFATVLRMSLGAWPVAYCDQDFAETGCVASLGSCPAFIANPSRVTLPSPIGPWRLVSFEQTGQRGTDLDTFYGTSAELARLAIPAPAAPRPALVSREEATAALSAIIANAARLAVYVAQG